MGARRQRHAACLVPVFVAVMVGCGGDEGVESSKEPAPAPPSPQESAKGKANAGPEELAIGETYTSPANGMEVTVEEPVAMDAPPPASGNGKNRKTGEPINTMPNFVPATERIVVFEATITNGGSAHVTLPMNTFELETRDGVRFERVIHAGVVGSSSNNLGEFLPGQSRPSLIAYEASRDAADLRLTFRPQGAAVALWNVPSVVEVPASEVPPGKAKQKGQA